MPGPIWNGLVADAKGSELLQPTTPLWDLGPGIRRDERIAGSGDKPASLQGDGVTLSRMVSGRPGSPSPTLDWVTRMVAPGLSSPLTAS